MPLNLGFGVMSSTAAAQWLGAVLSFVFAVLQGFPVIWDYLPVRAKVSILRRASRFLASVSAVAQAYSSVLDHQAHVLEKRDSEYHSGLSGGGTTGGG